MLRSYAVFNADQIDGVPESYYPGPDHDASIEPAGREADLDAFFAALPVRLRHQGEEAHYEPVPDRITMPPASLFTEPARTRRRPAICLTGLRGEELVAELASAKLGAELGLPVAHLDHHASYLGHWLLKADERAILTAAARAEEAAELLLKLGGRRAPDQGGAEEGQGDALDAQGAAAEAAPRGEGKGAGWQVSDGCG